MNLTALVTPFKNDKSLDLDNFKSLVLRQACCDGVVIAGTTGEGRSLTFDEKIKLVEVVQNLKHTHSLPAGFQMVLSLNDMEEVIKLSKVSSKLKLMLEQDAPNNLSIQSNFAILLTPPPYYKPSQKDIIDFYNQAINQCHLPIIIYNNPSRVGVDISCDTLDTLMSHIGIKAVKESNPDFRKVTTLSARHTTNSYNVWRR